MLLYCLVFIIIIYSRCIGSKDKLDSEVVTFYFLVCFQPLTKSGFFFVIFHFPSTGIAVWKIPKISRRKNISPGPNLRTCSYFFAGTQLIIRRAVKRRTSSIYVFPETVQLFDKQNTCIIQGTSLPYDYSEIVEQAFHSFNHRPRIFV